MKSIRLKFIVIISSLILSLSLLISVVAVNVSSNAIIDEAVQALRDLAQEGSVVVEEQMNSNFIFLEGVAKRDRIVDTNLDLQTKIRILEEETKGSPFMRIGISDLRGNLYFGENGNLGDVVEISEREYFQEALKGKRAVMKPSVSVDPQDNGQLIMVYAVPISDGNNITGVLVAVGEGILLSDIVKDRGYGEHGYAYIIDESGTVIGHVRPELVIEQYNPIEAVKEDSSVKALADLFEEILIEKEGDGNYFFNNQTVHAGFSPIGNYGWTLATVAEEDELIQGVTTMRRVLLILTFVMIGMGIGGAVFFGNSFAKPIVELQKNIDRLANYDLSVDKESKALKYLKRKDEIGKITKALVTMQKNLVDLVRDISNESSQVAASSEELTATSSEVSRVATEVARTIEEIAKGATEQAGETEKGVQGSKKLGESIEKEQHLLTEMNKSVESVAAVKDER